MSVADHNIVPGKKFWTWGNGPRGRMWDHILTDDDGPYIELMVGAYSDNQPDYSWLQPYETKSFSHVLVSVPRHRRREEGQPRRGRESRRERRQGQGRLLHHRPATRRRMSASRRATGAVGGNRRHRSGQTFSKQVALPAGIDEHDLVASIAADGKELVSYSPIRLETKPMPTPVTPPPAPKDIKTTEELYLAGLRIEQFHDPLHHAEAYWEEALRRDPGDIRVNTALGIDCLRKARYADAEKYLRKAIERLTDKYTSPKDGEAIYYLGLALRGQGKTDEAFATLYKATWSLAWRSAGYQALAEIAAARGEMAAALRFAEQSLQANARKHPRTESESRCCCAILGRSPEALQCVAKASELCDPLDVRAMAERWLASGKPSDAKRLADTMNQHSATAAETAAEYLDAGLWQDGTDVLTVAVAEAPKPLAISPMVYYYLGYFAEKLNRPQKAADYYKLAAQMSPDYCFPFQAEAIEVLAGSHQGQPPRRPRSVLPRQSALRLAARRGRKLWEQSAALDDSNAIVLRNLAIAYRHQKPSLPSPVSGEGPGVRASESDEGLRKAIASMEKAVALRTEIPHPLCRTGRTVCRRRHAGGKAAGHDREISRDRCRSR